jgi:chaperonin GroES
MAKHGGIGIEPLADRVVVKPAEKEEKTLSGIIISGSEKEKPAKGTVVAAGPGRYEDGKLVPMRVKVGDVVLFSKYGYDEVEVGDEDYLILPESSVLGILK